MSEHPRPPALPAKRGSAELTLRGGARPVRRKGASAFTSSVAIFVTAAPLAYLLVERSGVNTPHYYPTLRLFLFEQQDALAMALFGRVLYAFLLAIIVTVAHLILRPIFSQFKLIKQGYLTVMASVSVWTAVTLLIVEEWHEWGIVKRDLDTGALLNDELYLLLIGVIAFFGGVLLTAFAVKRVATLSQRPATVVPTRTVDGRGSRKPITKSNGGRL